MASDEQQQPSSATVLDPGAESDAIICNFAAVGMVIVGSTSLHHASPAADISVSVASLVGGESLPTDQLPGAAKKQKVKHKKGCQHVSKKPKKACCTRPVQTATEVAMSLRLLAD